MRALIAEDGLSRQALSAARALNAAGWTVGMAAQLRRGVAACSRAAARDHIVAAPQRDQDAFIEHVAEAVRSYGYEIVFGARDVDVLALSARRDEIPAVVPFPAHERLVRVFDKQELNSAAERAGVAVPRTAPATAEALATFGEPVVVKARLHATFHNGAAPPRLDTQLAATRAEAAARVAEIEAAGNEALLQEAVPEPRLVAYVLLADADSSIVARVQQEAEEVWPLGAGVSVRARTLPVDELLEAGAAALVRELGWTGLEIGRAHV
jgi:predicted ATP-grasp superfamily ATP-dependent carboligase